MEPSEDFDPMAQAGNWAEHQAMLDPNFAKLDGIEQMAEYGRACDANTQQPALFDMPADAAPGHGD